MVRGKRGKYPKENIQDSEHGENLKSRILHYHSSEIFTVAVIYTKLSTERAEEEVRELSAQIVLF
jgi:hypothetical protein